MLSISVCTRWCNEQLTTAFFLRASIDVVGKCISRVLATACASRTRVGAATRVFLFFETGEPFHLPSFLSSSSSVARWFLWIAHGEQQETKGVALHCRLAELLGRRGGHAHGQWEDGPRREGGATIHGGETRKLHLPVRCKYAVYIYVRSRVYWNSNSFRFELSIDYYFYTRTRRCKSL